MHFLIFCLRTRQDGRWPPQPTTGSSLDPVDSNSSSLILTGMEGWSTFRWNVIKFGLDWGAAPEANPEEAAEVDGVAATVWGEASSTI